MGGGGGITMMPTLKGTVVEASDGFLYWAMKNMDRSEGGRGRDGGMVPEDSFPHEKRILENNYRNS